MVNVSLEEDEEGGGNHSVGSGGAGWEEYQPLWEFWVPGVLLPTIGLLGLLGNAISIFILSRPQMRSSINCLLIGLASFDIVLILTSILMFGLPSIYTHSLVMGESRLLSLYFHRVFPYITPVVFPVGLISQTGSVYLTICVTIERYVAVCHPLKAKYLCTYGRAKLYILVIVLLSIGYNLPRFWEVTWAQVYSPALAANITEVVPTQLRENKTYIEVYINWLYLIFLYLTPICLLSVLNILIYREVRRATTLRADISRSQARELGLASMLLCVVMVFLLCNFPAMVVNILEHFGCLYHPLTQTNNLLITINSSVNFIIYCIFGHKFKRIFWTILVRLTGGRPSPAHTTAVLRYPAPPSSRTNGLAMRCMGSRPGQASRSSEQEDSACQAEEGQCRRFCPPRTKL